MEAKQPYSFRSAIGATSTDYRCCDSSPKNVFPHTVAPRWVSHINAHSFYALTAV